MEVVQALQALLDPREPVVQVVKAFRPDSPLLLGALNQVIRLRLSKVETLFLQELLLSLQPQLPCHLYRPDFLPRLALPTNPRLPTVIVVMNWCLYFT